jgi:hypothetical protein
MATYCIARIVVRYGRLAEFAEAMGRLVPLMEQRGWRLQAAYTTIAGNLHECYDVWEVPDANAVGAGLASLAQDPSFPALLAELRENVESETLSIVAKAPFSPG